MKEIILSKAKKGMPVLLLVILLYVLAIVGTIAGAALTGYEQVSAVYAGVALLVVSTIVGLAVFQKKEIR